MANLEQGRYVEKAATRRGIKPVSRRLRLAVDIAMALVYLLQMAPYQTGGWYHELCGLAFVVLLVVHHVINARWLRAEIKRRDWLPLILDAALVACVAGIALSGMAMAQHVKLLRVEGLAQVTRSAHAFFTYAGLMLISLHVGLHVPYAWLKRLPSGVRGLVVVAVLVGGAYAFVNLGVATKLSWGISFPDGTTPLVLLVGKHVLMALPFVLAGCGISTRRSSR